MKHNENTFTFVMLKGVKRVGRLISYSKIAG